MQLDSFKRMVSVIICYTFLLNSNMNYYIIIANQDEISKMKTKIKSKCFKTISKCQKIKNKFITQNKIVLLVGKNDKKLQNLLIEFFKIKKLKMKMSKFNLSYHIEKRGQIKIPNSHGIRCIKKNMEGIKLGQLTEEEKIKFINFLHVLNKKCVEKVQIKIESIQTDGFKEKNECLFRIIELLEKQNYKLFIDYIVDKSKKISYISEDFMNMTITLDKVVYKYLDAEKYNWEIEFRIIRIFNFLNFTLDNIFINFENKIVKFYFLKNQQSKFLPKLFQITKKFYTKYRSEFIKVSKYMFSGKNLVDDIFFSEEELLEYNKNEKFGEDPKKEYSVIIKEILKNIENVVKETDGQDYHQNLGRVLKISHGFLKEFHNLAVDKIQFSEFINFLLCEKEKTIKICINNISGFIKVHNFLLINMSKSLFFHKSFFLIRNQKELIVVLNNYIYMFMQ